MTIKEQILFNDMMDLIKEQANEIESLNFKLKKSRENEFSARDLYVRNKLEQEVQELKYKLKKEKIMTSTICKAYNKLNDKPNVNIFKRTINNIINTTIMQDSCDSQDKIKRNEVNIYG